MSFSREKSAPFLPVPSGEGRGAGIASLCVSRGQCIQPYGPHPNPLPRDEGVRRNRGFSLVELLVAIGILVVLASIFIPYAISKQEQSRRVQCSSNLGRIMQALRQYAADNGGHFPRVLYDAEKNPNAYTALTGPDSPSPFAADSKILPNDVTASLWLLVRGGYATPNIFICPSTSDTQDRLTNAQGSSVAPTARGNFRHPYNLSYSYATPFSAALGYRVNDDLPWDFALMADRNPGVIAPPSNARSMDLAQGNSRNHNQAGQNVLHPGGHVSFERSPYCGVGRDNIYTALVEKPLEAGAHPPADGVGVIGRNIGAAWNFDSYLVPMDNELNH